ncbi:MAG: DUF1565 domain-containing protein [Deltaproteobacteria bacterium]|nr:DUF1565 domain-containing protein [Deltaproteobacteria bacterium]
MFLRCRLPSLGAILVVLSGCGSPAADEPRCGPTAVEVAGACAPRFDACGPLEIAVAGGGCRRLGIETCAEGFTRDEGRGTCEPVLPAATCAPGTMAIPGETSCHEVAPCAAGTWGDIPVDATTIYVDTTSAVGTPDGTRDRPFRTISAGIAAAKIDALVAIAAGRYEEHIEITRPVRLFGVCPARVEIRGPKGDPKAWTIGITGRAELHRLSITSDREAISYCENDPLLLDHVWMHDVGARALGAYACRTDARLIVRDSLIESATGQGIFGAQGSGLVERSVIRGTRPLADGSRGQGAQWQWHARATGAQSLTVRRSVIEGNVDAGLSVVGADLLLEGSVIRATKLGKKAAGHGVLVSFTGSVRPAAEIRDTFFADHVNGAVYVEDADATLERVVVRGTKAAPNGDGDGIQVLSGARLEATDLVVEDTARTAIFAAAASLRLTRAIVRDSSGHGVQLQAALSPDHSPGTAEGTLSDVLIARARFGGVVVAGSKVTIRGMRVTGVTADAAGRFGDGIALVGWDFVGRLPAVADVAESSIDSCVRAGVSVFGSQLTMGTVQLSCNAFDLEVAASGASGAEVPFSVDDRGGNSCGCGAARRSCKGQSHGLAPVGL